MYSAALADHKSAIAAITRWFEAEWPSWYGPDGPGDAAADLKSWCDETALPVARIALDEAGHVIGIAALKTDGLGEEFGFSPFLSAMYVLPQYRGSGAGTLLTGAIAEVAKMHGYDMLYATTDGARGLLLRLGWNETGFRSLSDRGPLAILSKAL